MQIFKSSYLTLMLVSIFFGCKQDGQNSELSAREKEIVKEEQRLTAWQEQLELREKRLITREKKTDSLRAIVDTLGVYNQNLIGSWKVSMNCTESSCEGYVIGDSKTERWEISYQGKRILAKAYSGKKFIRTYIGSNNDNVIVLQVQPAPGTQTKMEVTLAFNPNKNTVMTGERIITKVENCTTTFALSAEKL
jgi:hypothetical protein